MRRRRLLFASFAFALPFATAVIASSCGARTELEVDSYDEPEEDAGPDVVDAPPDIVDAPPDIVDAPPDVPEDVPPDGLPACDPDVLYIYLVTSETDLYRYRPDTGAFSLVGNLSCPSAGTPFSMGVSRTGIAYVVYNEGSLFRVDTADASCTETDWQSGTGGFNTFGMGYAIDDDQMGETLHVVEIHFDSPSLGLGTIDTNTFDFNFIGPLSQNPGFAMELTSSDDGKLYGYMLNSGGIGGNILEIDKHTADVVNLTPLSIGSMNDALAFAYWGGDFYIFTSSGDQTTTVTRYQPSTGIASAVATLNRTVVGAGVSTCKVP